MSIPHSSCTGHDIDEPWRYADNEAELARAFVRMQMQRNGTTTIPATAEQIDTYIAETELRFNRICQHIED